MFVVYKPVMFVCLSHPVLSARIVSYDILHIFFVYDMYCLLRTNQVVDCIIVALKMPRLIEIVCSIQFIFMGRKRADKKMCLTFRKAFYFFAISCTNLG